MLGNIPDSELENSRSTSGIPQKPLENSPSKCGIFYLDKIRISVLSAFVPKLDGVLTLPEFTFFVIFHTIRICGANISSRFHIGLSPSRRERER